MARAVEQIPTLTVRGGPAGWDTEVRLNGVEVPCLRAVTLEVRADGLAVATLEVLVKPDVEVKAEASVVPGA